jgi:hypothetical protein
LTRKFRDKREAKDLVYFTILNALGPLPNRELFRAARQRPEFGGLTDPALEKDVDRFVRRHKSRLEKDSLGKIGPKSPRPSSQQEAEHGITPLQLQRVTAAARVWLQSTGMDKFRMLPGRPFVGSPEVVKALWMQKLLAECEVVRARRGWRSDLQASLEAALSQRIENDPSPHKTRAYHSLMEELRNDLAGFNELGFEKLELPKVLTAARLMQADFVE